MRAVLTELDGTVRDVIEVAGRPDRVRVPVPMPSSRPTTGAERLERAFPTEVQYDLWLISRDGSGSPRSTDWVGLYVRRLE